MDSEKARAAQGRVAAFQKDFKRVEDEIAKVIVGHHEVVRSVLTAFFANGHALLEGVPGLGKTLLVRTLGRVMQLQFNRIQFTPDLMPADILGTNLVATTPEGDRVFRFQKGPIFSQILLADEVNRATPKTQSALLEAMQERSVTTGGKTYELDRPFLVMATQNPLEMEGTYPLPEAQLDRFLLKVNVSFSSVAELRQILDRTTDAASEEPGQVMDGPRILEMQRLVREVVAAPHIKDYASRIVWSSHPDAEIAPPKVKRFVRYGASPRGAQAIILAAKVSALVDGRYNAGFDDVKRASAASLRHRILLNFEGEAETIKTDQVIEEILATVPAEVVEAKV